MNCKEIAFELEEQVIALDFLKDTFKAMDRAAAEGVLPGRALYFLTKELGQICDKLDAIKDALLRTVQKEAET